MTVFKYSLRRGLLKPVSMIFNMVLPIAIMLISDAEAFDMVGGRAFFFLAFILLFGGFMMAGGIQADKLDGVTVRILAGPITFRSYLIGNFFAGMVPMAALCLILGGIGFARFDWTLAFTGLFMLVLAMISAVSIGMSFVWSCLFKDKEASMVAFVLIVMLMGLIGGLTVPLDILPDWVRYTGAVFPPHWAARGFEQLILEGTATTEYWLSMLALAMFSIALILYGSRRRIT
ncbi:MAG: ABC transporter permease [Defluviitaleaceae bacterium]|nr:ABC transporter permease [Defluviitaleaceae bacterium]